MDQVAIANLFIHALIFLFGEGVRALHGNETIFSYLRGDKPTFL